MTSTLNIDEYIGLKLSFPLLNTKNLVKIPSRVKTHGVIELMEINDYDIYERQQNEIKQIVNQIVDCLKCNNDTSELFSLKYNTEKKHIKLCSYYLLPNSFFWIKSHPC